MSRLMMRRRGARGFSPLDIADLQVWYAADAITGLVDGDPVPSWSDGSANARTASQATAARRPIYKASIVNGKPVVRFDGVDDGLLTDAFSVSADGTWTAFAVSDLRGSSGTNHMIVTQDSLSGSTRVAQYLRYNADAGVVESIAFNSAINSYTDVSGAFGVGFDVLSAYRPATSVEVIVNGSSNGSTATAGTPANASVSLGLGFHSNGAAGYAQVDVAEVLLYGRALTAGERQQVRDYLYGKYAITGT